MRGQGPALLLLDEQGRRRARIAAGQRVRLGRNSDNDVIVSDDEASRHHAILWEAHGRYHVGDEGSTNGTWLNSRRVIGSQPVRVGDRLRIGNTTFLLTEAQPGDVGVRRGKTGGAFPAVLAGAGLLLMLLLLILVLSWPSRVALRTPAQPTRRPTAARAGVPSPTSVQAAPALEWATERALRAAVALVVLKEGTDEISFGSGSIVSSAGHILTNFHNIGDPDTGQLYNAAGWALVGVNPPGLSGSPEFEYIAELVEADVQLDLALLQVSRLEDGDPLPVGFSLTSVPIGDSNAVQIGDPISIIGFPELGGVTVTFTKGTVSGFHDERGLVRAWIKTDAEISPGNSGGMALNEQGELIGVPTVVTASQRVSGKIGWIRPIELAQPLLRSAR